MHTIKSSPLHPIWATTYLDELPTLAAGMNLCVTACFGKCLCP